MTPTKRSPALDTKTSQEIIQSYTEGGLKLDAAWERRLPTIYRLMMSGATTPEIHRMIGGELGKIRNDVEAIRYLIDAIPDIERIRADISVELDQLYIDTIDTLHSSDDRRGGTKAKLIEQAREILMGKADLYGLRSATLNVNNNTRLLSIAAELRTLGSSDESKPSPTQLHLEADRERALSATDAASVGRVESGDLSNWRGAGWEVETDGGTRDELPAFLESDLDRRP